MPQAAVFIDGGYLTKVLRAFGEPRVDYGLFVRWAADGFDLFRTYYYDCLPYQSPLPSEEERRRTSGKQAFFTALNRLDRFAVRLGRLTYRGTDVSGSPIFEQKRVDLQLGLDAASVVTKGRVELVVLVTGDSDLIPAVKRAREESVLVRLIHGPKSTYNQDLWDEVDERKEITLKEISQLLLGPK